MLARKPEAVIEHAVKGMLPKNRLGRKLRRKLKVYRGPSHPHAAQQPEPSRSRVNEPMQRLFGTKEGKAWI